MQVARPNGDDVQTGRPSGNHVLLQAHGPMATGVCRNCTFIHVVEFDRYIMIYIYIYLLGFAPYF